MGSSCGRQQVFVESLEAACEAQLPSSIQIDCFPWIEPGPFHNVQIPHPRRSFEWPAHPPLSQSPFPTCMAPHDGALNVPYLDCFFALFEMRYPLPRDALDIDEFVPSSYEHLHLVFFSIA